MKQHFSHQNTQQVFSVIEGRDPHALTKMVAAFRNGANPWSENAKGIHLLDVCLQDGRHTILSAWIEASRRAYQQKMQPSSKLSYVAISSLQTNPVFLDFVGAFVHLAKNDRQYHLRNALFPKNKNSKNIDINEEFIEFLSLHSSPQRWQAIASALLMFPHLQNSMVSPYPVLRDENNKPLSKKKEHDDVEQNERVPVLEELIKHAPNQVLLGYFENCAEKKNLDWRNNSAILGRLRHLLDPAWGPMWQEAGVVFYGSDNNGDTLLHHYLRNTTTDQLCASSIELLLQNGNQWKDRNHLRQSCEDLALLHKGSPLLNSDVAHILNTQLVAVEQFHPVGRLGPSL